jgi:phage anti-repressor protein
MKEEKQFVDARLLHRFLKTGRDFSTWIKNRIEEYAFEENQDYIVKSFDSPDLGNQKKRGGDRRSIDYLLTIDTAKELAMVERTEVGRQVRRYFIEVEKKYMEQFSKYGQRLVFDHTVRFVKIAHGTRFFSLADLVKSKRLSQKAYRILRSNATKMPIVGSTGKVYCVPETAISYIASTGFQLWG